MEGAVIPAKEKVSRWWKCSSWQMHLVCESYGGKRFKDEVLEGKREKIFMTF